MYKNFIRILKIVILLVVIQILFMEKANADTTKIVPVAPKITHVSINNGKTTIKWKKVENADGYKIYMSTSKNGKYTRIKTIKNVNTVTFKKKGLSKTKEYFFKVSSFTYYNSKKVHSKTYSKIRSGGGLLASKTLTATNSPKARNINLKIATNKINGVTLKSGQRFNWWKVLGPLTKAQGYKKAIAYVNGKNYLSIGGGICQVSTNLYQCAKSIDMKIIERHEHGKDISYTEIGEDATVTYGLRNLIFKNNYPFAVKIIASANNSTTLCQIYKIGDF